MPKHDPTIAAQEHDVWLEYEQNSATQAAVAMRVNAALWHILRTRKYLMKQTNRKG